MTTAKNSNFQSPHHHRLSPSCSNHSYTAKYTSSGTETCKTKAVETLNGEGRRRARESSYKNVLSSVPSRIEVENAISDLRRLMLALSPSISEFNQHRKMMYPHDPNMLKSSEFQRTYSALHMLESEQPVEKMVVSIASDKTVWDAILNNKAVQDLCGSLGTAKEEKPQSSDRELTDLLNLILKWVFGIFKVKVIELAEALASFVNEVFCPTDKKKPTSQLSDLLEEKLRSSLLLSIIIVLIVVVTRSQESS